MSINNNPRENKIATKYLDSITKKGFLTKNKIAKKALEDSGILDRLSALSIDLKDVDLGKPTPKSQLKVHLSEFEEDYLNMSKTEKDPAKFKKRIDRMKKILTRYAIESQTVDSNIEQISHESNSATQSLLEYNQLDPELEQSNEKTKPKKLDIQLSGTKEITLKEAKQEKPKEEISEVDNLITDFLTRSDLVSYNYVPHQKSGGQAATELNQISEDISNYSREKNEKFSKLLEKVRSVRSEVSPEKAAELITYAKHLKSILEASSDPDAKDMIQEIDSALDAIQLKDTPNLSARPEDIFNHAKSLSNLGDRISDDLRSDSTKMLSDIKGFADFIEKTSSKEFKVLKSRYDMISTALVEIIALKYAQKVYNKVTLSQNLESLKELIDAHNNHLEYLIDQKVDVQNMEKIDYDKQLDYIEEKGKSLVASFPRLFSVDSIAPDIDKANKELDEFEDEFDSEFYDSTLFNRGNLSLKKDNEKDTEKENIA